MAKGKKLIILILVFSLLGISQSTRAEDITPQTGAWKINEEFNGGLRRGLNIEVQNDILILTFLGYEQTGESKFWLARGRLQKSSNELTADLVEFEGGMAFGDSIKNATFVGSRGEVTMRFTKVNEGEICLPREPCKAISTFNFGYEEGASELLGRWLVTFWNERLGYAENEEINFTQVMGSSDPAVIESVSGTAWPLIGNEAEVPYPLAIICDRLVQPNPEPYSCKQGLNDVYDTFKNFHLVMTRNTLQGHRDYYGDERLIGIRVGTASGRSVMPN